MACGLMASRSTVTRDDGGSTPPAPVQLSVGDFKVTEGDIKRILALRHWTGSKNGPRHDCRCEDCRAIVQVVAKAREERPKKKRRLPIR
jgi:hypothetical protein